MTAQPQPAWERAIREVAFIICPHCHRRVEQELESDGSAVQKLYHAYLAHSVECFFRGRIYSLSYREIQQQVRTEEIALDEPIDWRDLCTDYQLHRRAARLAHLSALSPESARRLIEMKISRLVHESDKYVCRECGRYITKRMAKRGGVGRYCAIQTKD